MADGVDGSNAARGGFGWSNAARGGFDGSNAARAVITAHASLGRQVQPFMEFDLLTQLTTGHTFTRKCCADIMRTLRENVCVLVSRLRAAAVAEADKPRVSVLVGPTPTSLREQADELAFIVNTYTNAAPLAASQIADMQAACGVLVDASERHVMAALSVPSILHHAMAPAPAQ